MNALAVVGLCALSVITASAAAAGDHRLSEREVHDAQRGWCQALVEISVRHREQGIEAAREYAEFVIDNAYGYQLGPVLFKPTLAVVPQTFRTTRAGALSYFVGGDADYPQDSGFALKDWVACEPDTAAVWIAGTVAMTLGKVHFRNIDGDTVSVDKTWGFVLDDAGVIRIMAHHSSLEYQATEQ
jgi:hypothetical protein